MKKNTHQRPKKKKALNCHRHIVEEVESHYGEDAADKGGEGGSGLTAAN